MPEGVAPQHPTNIFCSLIFLQLNRFIMVPNEALAKMSIQEIAQAIETHHQETTLLYEALAQKITKQTDGTKYMSDDRVDEVVYWYKVAVDHPEILASNFDSAIFNAVDVGFKTMVSVKNQEESTRVILKTPRDILSKDAAALCSMVRRRVKENESNPVFKLILQKEPRPRQSASKPTPPKPPKAS